MIITKRVEEPRRQGTWGGSAEIPLMSSHPTCFQRSDKFFDIHAMKSLSSRSSTTDLKTTMKALKLFLAVRWLVLWQSHPRGWRKKGPNWKMKRWWLRNNNLCVKLGRKGRDIVGVEVRNGMLLKNFVPFFYRENITIAPSLLTKGNLEKASVTPSSMKNCPRFRFSHT